jgi:glycosyltransferase involved in cell wall biosynthesis
VYGFYKAAIMKLSVIIPNRNDTVMLAITVRSALEELKAINGDGEVIIVDNSDLDLWNIIKKVNVSPLNLGYVEEGKVQLIRQSFPALYSARATAIRAARGEYCFNVDSHMILGHNILKDLVDFMDSDVEHKIGFGYAPIGWVSQHESLSRHDIRTDGGTIFGSWGMQYEKPTKICWNFASHIFRTKWFNEELGGYSFFDTKRVSWGGGEFYLPLKSWLLGYESWAVPTSPLYHIGPFSKELESRTQYRYRLYGQNGEGKLGIGVFAAFYALGGDEMKEEAHKAEMAGIGHNYGISIEKDWEAAKQLAYEDWPWIEKRQKLSYAELIEKQPWNSDNCERWTNWNPSLKLNRIFDLNQLG